MTSEARDPKPLLHLIAEKAQNGGFSLSDFWREDYGDLRGYPLAEILRACEELVDHGRIKQREDGVYVPTV